MTNIITMNFLVDQAKDLAKNLAAPVREHDVSTIENQIFKAFEDTVRRTGETTSTLQKEARDAKTACERAEARLVTANKELDILKRGIKAVQDIVNSAEVKRVA